MATRELFDHGEYRLRERATCELAPRKYEPHESQIGGVSGGLGRGARGFWTKIDQRGDCWRWRGYVDRDGCGKFTTRIDGKQRTVRATRYAFALVHGEPATGAVIYRTCRTRGCVNPHHLRAGTMKDANRPDNRGEPADTRGEMSGRAKLRNDDVFEIRSWAGVYGAAPLLARIYGISVHHVRTLLAGRGWPHLRNPRNQRRRTYAEIGELRSILALRTAPAARAEDYAGRNSDPLEAA